MQRRRNTLVILPLLLWGLALATSVGFAGVHVGESFTKARFDALQSEGALILVDVAAPWCGTCAKQASVITRYRESHPDVPLHVLRVDYDTQKEWVHFFKAPRQSTLLLYRGGEQIWFAVAETREQVLFGVLDDGAAG